MNVFYMPLQCSDSNLLCYSFLTLNGKIFAQYKQEVKLDEVDNNSSHVTCKKHLKKSHMNAFKKFDYTSKIQNIVVYLEWRIETVYGFQTTSKITSCIRLGFK